jgi:hypothetical protein
MMDNIEKVRKQLEYERDCLRECLNRDISLYSGETDNASLYYQFVMEDLVKIERSLEDFEKRKPAVA